MYKNVIVRTPCRAVINGISSHPELGKPDYDLALKQHAAYIRAMESLGITVRVLPADEAYPDSCFVEDVAVLSERCAVVTNPGAKTRNGEAAGIIPVLKDFYPEKDIRRIISSGTLEGGDVMRIENRFYVGLSARTNQAGVDQFAALLNPYGYEVIPITLKEVLHLKTGVNYLADNRLLVSGEFIAKPEFAAYDKTVIPPEEDYAANCLWINGTVVLPAGFPATETLLKQFGYPTLPVDTSEFRKIDGGLSCLSLRF
ncbi:arginine deiminase family protein [Treponema primitia]|uniref:dimethylarginine dimethylaminohydrolase family protein n=1 Tax=Treponema primitia TaxID=88058 RepID=UPI00397F0F49